MQTSKVSRGEGARYGGLDGSAGSFPAQLRAPALGYLFFPHDRYGLVFGVGAALRRFASAAFTSAAVEAPNRREVISAIAATSASRLVVSLLGLGKPALLLRQTAQLVIGASGAVAIVGRDADLERLVVGVLGLGEAALLMRHDGQVGVASGLSVAIVERDEDLERLVASSASVKRRCSCSTLPIW
jgi:hypothetical protein